MDRRHFFTGAAASAMLSVSARTAKAAVPVAYPLPYERIPSRYADTLSADGRYAAMPLRFRPDNEIALISFAEKIEHRLVFAEWLHATDVALNSDGSRLAVVCRKNYIESAILIVNAVNFKVVEIITTSLDIYQRPAYWGDSLFYIRSIEADPERLASRYPGRGETETNRHRLWQHVDGKAKPYIEADLPRPEAFDLIGENTYIYRCDFHEAYHTPNLARYATTDGRRVCVMDGYPPMPIVAAIGDHVYLTSTEGLVRLDARLDVVLDMFESMRDTGTSSMNLRNVRQFQVRLSTKVQVVPIRSGYEYNNVHRFNGADFLVRTANNGGKSNIMVVTPEGFVRQDMQINTLSDEAVRYHKIETI